MADLTKEELMAAEDRRPVRVAVPEWGGDCWLLPMGGDDRDAFDQWATENTRCDEPNWRGLRAQLVAACLCDSGGELFGFTDAEILALGQKSAAALDRLFEVAQRINRITDKDLDELEKNSPSGPNDGPG